MITSQNVQSYLWIAALNLLNILETNSISDDPRQLQFTSLLTTKRADVYCAPRVREPCHK